MTELVAEPRVVRPDTAKQEQRRQRKEDPAQRIAGLAPRHDEPDGCYRQHSDEGRELEAVALPRVPGRSTQWPGGDKPTRYVAKLGVELPGLLVSIRMTAFITDS
jgi:hypothetical protein